MADKDLIFKTLSVTLVFSFITVGYVEILRAEDTAVKTTQAPAVVFEPDDNDPLEPINRFTSGFNRIFRAAILDPLVDGYQALMPDPMEEVIGNAASNLSEPVTAVSSLLAGDTENASNATKRFFVNTTVGLGGTSDRASEMGIPQRREDLGQAAAVHGAESGPYLVLPFLGPSNTRDALGTVVTSVASPMPLVGAVAVGGVEYSKYQDDIQAVTEGALDPYTVEKNAYRQYRNYQIKNGEIEKAEFPTFEVTDK